MGSESTGAPEVSVIMATYNRSNIISYAISTVLWQSFTDWELLVIGDACTDDTDSVVNRFRDARVRFSNLAQNFGEQSGPNNEGMKLARGKYIAFLNHDDLWFPDHLAKSLETLKVKSADLVLAAGLVDHGEAGLVDILGVPDKRRQYHPSMTFVPASNWLFKRELMVEVGGWRPASELRMVPSFDWQHRVFDAGKKIVFTEQITVLALPSSSRHNAYLDRAFSEHARYFGLIKSENFREDLFHNILNMWAQDRYYDERIYLRRYLVGKLKNFAILIGLNPARIGHRFRFKKGEILWNYRKRRGLK